MKSTDYDNRLRSLETLASIIAKAVFLPILILLGGIMGMIMTIGIVVKSMAADFAKAKELW